MMASTSMPPSYWLTVEEGGIRDGDEDKYGKQQTGLPLRRCFNRNWKSSKLWLTVFVVALLFLMRWFLTGSGSGSSSSSSVNLNADDSKSTLAPSASSLRQEAVRQAFRHAWNGYEEFAWGFDILHPVSKRGSDWFGLGMTIIDGLDTAQLMRLDDIVVRGTQWIQDHLVFDRSNENSNVFETTIRVLGGLLTMFELTKNPVFLQKSVQLADSMMPAFETKSGIPVNSINFQRKVAVAAGDGLSSTAEATTLQLEWRHLTVLTGDTKYWKVAERAMQRVMQPSPNRKAGLVPIFIHPQTGQFIGNNYRIGSRGDSYYEYLAKQYVQTDFKELIFADWFEESIDGILEHLLAYSVPNHLTYIGELQDGFGVKLTPKMDHLVCYLPGTIALHVSKGKQLTADAITKLSPKHQLYLEFAKNLTETCYETYVQMPTGLAPEIVYFNDVPLQHPNADTASVVKPDIIVHNLDAHNLLRPETVESLFYLYRILGDTKYQDWGWKIFQSFENYTKVPSGGYTSLSDVRVLPHPPTRDHMETFFLGETLKYFYLLFDDSRQLLPLDQWVFNTEAHPLPILHLNETVKQQLHQQHLGMWQ